MNGLAGNLLAHGTAAAVAALATLGALWALASWLGHIKLRPVRPYDQLPHLADRSMETGAPVVTWIAGGAQDLALPETVAAHALYDSLCRRVARTNQAAPLLTQNPVSLLLAMNALQASYERHGYHSSFCGQVRFWGSAPLPAAAGIALDREPQERTATVLVGSFGQEGLWLAQAMADHAGPGLVVAGDPLGAALARLYLGQEESEALPGEDLYAGRAYLDETRAGQLLAEDWARWLMVAIMLIAVLLTSLGYGG